MEKSLVKVSNFKSVPVYRSSRDPSYAAWVSFFPGRSGKWYISCEEFYKPEKELPKVSKEKWYIMGLPYGYDKSGYAHEIVLLESSGGMDSWDVISRQSCRFQHSAGQFAQANISDDEFIRFTWQCYSIENDGKNGEIMYRSNDKGRTWVKQKPFHDSMFASYPHRLRTLKDGTLVLALPLSHAFSLEYPRTASNLRSSENMQMTLCFSYDKGDTWTVPMPIYGGQSVSETDFVELGSGDLLCINNSIFARPGRQIIYRTDHGFMPGQYENVTKFEKTVPETICIIDDGTIIGAMRTGEYSWSGDEGMTWQVLDVPSDCKNDIPEIYQPWIQCIGNGRIACAGHYGFDDPIKKDYGNYICLHTFDVKMLGKTIKTDISITRDYDDSKERWFNSFTIKLTGDRLPLAGKKTEFIYFERDLPGYCSFDEMPLGERLKLGGKIIYAVTDSDGCAHVSIPGYDLVTYVHSGYQAVARFNADGSDPGYIPAMSLQYNFYCYMPYK